MLKKRRKNVGLPINSPLWHRVNRISLLSRVLGSVLLWICFNNIFCRGEPGKKIDVYVAGFFPTGGCPKQTLGRGVMPALELAVEHVNAHRTTLRNYKLHVVWNDTECDTAIATKAFFDMMKDPPHKLMLFGAACTLVTDPLVKAAKHWHITQLSYADTHPMFSALKYPNFFRMAPSEKEFNMPRIHLLHTFNWTRIGTLFQNIPRHALAHNHLLSILDKRDEFEIAETQSFADELQDQLEKLMVKDIRIILGYFDEKWARRIFCEAYQKKMYGKNIQWIITGMYRDKWWTFTDNDTRADEEPGGKKGCMVEEIMTALEGCIMTDLLPLASDNALTVSGKNISHYEKAYTKRRGNEYSRFHGYTYDGVWAMALAIQEVGQVLRKQNYLHKTNVSIQDFRYRDEEWGNLFNEALAGVTFEGVTGPVEFTKDHVRKGYILLKQFQDGKEVKIGEYDGIEDVLLLEKGHAIYWPGGDPPLDRTVKRVEKSRLNLKIYVVFVTFASLGIIMAIVFLSINIHFRNQRYIKMSSPYLNNMIIIGCMFTYLSVILLGLDSGLTSESSFPMICTARAWVLMSGFTLAFGSMFSKTWRVHSIFTDVQLNKKVIKDYQLFMVVFVLLSIDIAIMTTWQIVDPFRRDTKLVTPYMRGDIQVIPENEYCMSDNMTIFIGCIYACKGLLMIFGCFLAWETRHVSIPALNDSKYIGMSVYNVVIMCVIGVPISYILSDKQDAMYFIISVFILFCTTGTLCLVFVPKIIELRRNPQGTIDKRMVRPTLKPPKRNDSDSDVSDLHDQIKKAEGDRQLFMKKLKEREEEMMQLVEQLGDELSDAPLDSFAGSSPAQPSSPRRSSRIRSIDRLKIEGHSMAETSEVTDVTSSICSGISQDEYVVGKQPCVSSSTSSTITSLTTTTIHHQQHDYHPNISQNQQMNSTGASAIDRQPRRGTSITSPDHSHREVAKSVSFRLEGNDSSTTIEAPQLLQMSRPTSSTASPSPAQSPPHHLPQMPMPIRPQQQVMPVTCLASQYHHPVRPPPQHVIISQTPPPPAYVAPNLPYRSSSAQKIYQPCVGVLEGSAYGGYGGVYIHDYRGPPMMHNEQGVYQDGRSSRGSIVDSRPSSRSDAVDFTPKIYTDGIYSGQPVMPGMRMPPPMENMTHLPPLAGSQPPIGFVQPMPIGGRNPEAPPEAPRRSSLRVGADTYSHLHRNIYIPLNNEGEKAPTVLPAPRKSRDLTVVNNTSAPSQFNFKNNNAHANLPLTSLGDHQQIASIIRRGSEPPRPVGRNPIQMKNRSFDDLECGIDVPVSEEQMRDPRGVGWRASLRREDERDKETRTISRAHLRRDSFGEVVSRRSPSQDSLEFSKNRSSPEIDESQPHDLVGGVEDSWSCTASSRQSPSQDSLQRNDGIPRERIPSQESLGTMSSRGSISGSIYSVTSARSDAASSGWNTKLAQRQILPGSSKRGSYLNGDLAESTASNDDLAHQSGKEGFREPVGLHRTTSEPYYNFDSLDIPDGPLFRNLHGMPLGTVDDHQVFEPETRTLGRHKNPSSYGGYGGILESGAFIHYSHSLRGRSSAKRRQTTSSVAAAIAAAKSKNASDNALDHDTSILPIFQKLLSERQSGRGRNFTMSSCPNITIKCDIVEYL